MKIESNRLEYKRQLIDSPETGGYCLSEHAITGKIKIMGDRQHDA
jgi:hypothetical protein